jgi:hypothetical protein
VQFRYYITNLFDGKVQGTNDEKVADNVKDCEEYFVVDSETGKWLTGSTPIDIGEIPPSGEEE